jgi:hypothetical protein
MTENEMNQIISDTVIVIPPSTLFTQGVSGDASASKQKGQHKQDQKDKKYDLGDPGGCPGDACKTEHSGNQSDNQQTNRQI